jgi:hypothetical protein
MIVSHGVFLTIRNVSNRSFRKNQNMHFMLNIFFMKTVLFMKLYGKI